MCIPYYKTLRILDNVTEESERLLTCFLLLLISLLKSAF
jgi:hypothetical protein